MGLGLEKLAALSTRSNLRLHDGQSVVQRRYRLKMLTAMNQSETMTRPRNGLGVKVRPAATSRTAKVAGMVYQKHSNLRWIFSFTVISPLLIPNATAQELRERLHPYRNRLEQVVEVSFYQSL